MDEKRHRFSFMEAWANKEWICSKSKGSETPAVDGSTTGKRMYIVSSIRGIVFPDVLLGENVIEWMEFYR